MQTLSARLLIPRLLSGLFSWLQLVNDATLILESSSVTVSTAEAEGGTVEWDGISEATVALGKTVINLWIGKNAATVNGKSTAIDPTNAKVVPEIINDRTMLPLRFVTENLGATVRWEKSTQTITITYTP